MTKAGAEATRAMRDKIAAPSESGTKSSAGSTPAPSNNAGGRSTAAKPRFASVRLFCFKQLPTGFKKEFLAALNPPPAACSSGPQKTRSTGDH